MVGCSPFLGRSPSNYNIFYHTWIWLSKILTVQEFGSQISLSLVRWMSLTTFCGRQPLVEHNLQWKRTFGGRTTFSEKWTLLGSLGHCLNCWTISFGQGLIHLDKLVRSVGLCVNLNAPAKMSATLKIHRNHSKVWLPSHRFYEISVCCPSKIIIWVNSSRRLMPINKHN